jgi:copper transport protein
MVLIGLLAFQTAWAHATLVRSDPAANSGLVTAPAEIRLWFSEPVEPQFSGFTLLESSGKTIDTLTSQVDPADAKQMFMQSGSLPGGLFTVVWHVVSAADGHATQGSFAFTIGNDASATGTSTPTAEIIPADNALIRWFNLLSMSLAMGSIGFVLFVWTPAIQNQSGPLERRMNRLIWAGWVLLGVASVLMLLLQVSLAAQVSILSAISHPALMQVVTKTRFGTLWLVRMTLWLLLGLEIFLATVQKNRAFYWLALVFGSALLLTTSLFSHANAAQDSASAVLNDWLHLTMTALWIGGLVQFLNVFSLVRRTITPVLPTFDKLVGYFSNFARVVVAGLIITGLYAAWLQVGSVEALVSTLYGQALLVKLVLILPLLGVAGINLWFTHRGLQAGQIIWAGRLRVLIAAEVILTLCILVAVGAMTSISPSRTVLAQRALTASPASKPIEETQMSDAMHVQLRIEPGWVGSNTFTLTLSDHHGKPITDASLLRLRFDHQRQDLGESELRIQPPDNGSATGTYHAAGANLSQEGTWRIRMTVQRPAQYDALVDFQLQVPAAPPTSSISVDTPLSYRIPALLLAGLLAFGVGGFFTWRSRFLSGAGLLSRALMIVGAVFLANAIASLIFPS